MFIKTFSKQFPFLKFIQISKYYNSFDLRNHPVILDKNGKLLSIDAHQEAGKPHAEVLALKNAYFHLTQDSAILSLQESHQIHQYLKQNAKDIFHNSTLYTTLEPCMHEGKTPSCASLIKSSLVTLICDINEA